MGDLVEFQLDKTVFVGWIKEESIRRWFSVTKLQQYTAIYSSTSVCIQLAILLLNYH